MIRLQIKDKFDLYFDIRKKDIGKYENICRANPELFKLAEKVGYTGLPYYNCKVPKCCIKRADLIRRLLREAELL